MIPLLPALHFSLQDALHDDRNVRKYEEIEAIRGGRKLLMGKD